jgi:uncharacterized protein
MTEVFADSSYFVALMSPADALHREAIRPRPNSERLVTTAWVIAEVGSMLAKPPHRVLVVKMMERLRRDTTAELLPPDLATFDRGLDLFAQRLDKAWSLTDCISFVVMKDRKIRRALTGDHHFKQAGFEVLLSIA